MKINKVLALLLGGMVCANCLAIDITPGDLVPSPAGISFFQLSVQQVERNGFYKNGDLRLKNPSLIIEQLFFKYGIYSEIGTMPSYAHIEIPYTSIESSDHPIATPEKVNGVGDVNLAFGIWPYADREQHRYLAFGGYLVLPTGSYDSNRLYNAGANRYSVDFQVAYQMAIMPNLAWLTAIDAMWFTDNKDFGRQHLTQHSAPFYTVQTGLRYFLNENISLSALWVDSVGAESTIDGVKKEDRLDIQRYQIGTHARFDNNILSLLYGAELQTENGLLQTKRWVLRGSHIF